MWFLAWIPHALAGGLNPFFSHAIFEPTGVNLAQNTEAPLLGLITAPFAPFLGPVARANLLMVLAMPVSASAAFVVMRRWQVWGPAAALGGLVYGFSPYCVGQGLGHVVLMFIPIPPFIAMTVVSILHRNGSSARLGLQLGLLLAAQFLCEPEIFATVAIIAVWGVVCAAIRYPSKVVDAARFSAKALGIALAVAAAILAYPIWMMLEGPQHYTGTAQPVPNPFYNDLLSFVDPGPLQRISLGIHFSGVHFSGAEAGAYIGIPILLVAAIFVWRSRFTPRMQIATAILFGAMLLSLGSHLSVDGRMTHVPLPFLLLVHAPLVSNILPARISLEVAAGLAAILAFGLDDMHRGSSRAHKHSSSVLTRGGVAACALVLLLLVVAQLPQWPYASQPVHVLPKQVLKAIPPGDPVAITYPYALGTLAKPMLAEPMLWQAEAQFAFSIVGGYAEHPDTLNQPTVFPNPIRPSGLDLFLEGQEGYSPSLRPHPVDYQLVRSTRSALVDNHIRLVIVDRSFSGASPVIGLFSRVLGPARVTTPTFELWVTTD